MVPTIGRTVHYVLSSGDAQLINDRLKNEFTDSQGNQAAEGDVCAAVVVRTFLGTTANLQVLLDGTDSYWATSRSEGDGPGFWSWPPRA